jgi:phage replication-related protein YjqB (UPF0714/DUF867 family)
MATATTTIKKAFDTQDDLKTHREHCAVAARTLASLDRVRGQQVRVRHDDGFALYTVSELLHETTASVVRMGLPGRQRLRPDPEPDGEFDGVLDTTVADPDLCDEDARTAGELVERLDDDGSQTHLIAIAPHGGDIEPHTDEQAERVADRLGSQLASAWRCKGWRPNGGAFVRWHITSTDIDPSSFPLLGTVASRRFTRAVAFHGFDDEAGVLIGGTAPGAVKERVRGAIAGVLPADLKVRIAEPRERYAGDDPNNIVNRLSPCGGIQIEQGSSPRDDHAIAIADAVADVLRPRSPRDLAWLEDSMAQLWARVRSIADRLRG